MNNTRWSVSLMVLLGLALSLSACSEQLVDTRSDAESPKQQEIDTALEGESGTIVPRDGATTAQPLPQKYKEARARYKRQQEKSAQKSSQFPSTYVTSPTYGGNGGTNWNEPLVIPEWNDTRRLSLVRVYSGRVVDAIEIWWEDEDGYVYYGGKHGGGGGQAYDCYLVDGEYIHRVDVRHGRLVDNLTFYTNYKMCRMGTGSGGSLDSWSASDRQIHGFFGREGDHIDQIGFYAYSPENMTR